jgi:hypothetical protein
MPGTAIAQAGNYSLLIDTGYDVNSFTLDSATKGLLDGTYPLGPGSDFADVTESTTQISIKRGRRDIGDQFGAGTMQFTINDVDGIFNPFDDDGPYYNTPDALPGLAPLRAVELIRYDDNDNPEYLYAAALSITTTTLPLTVSTPLPCFVATISICLAKRLWTN